MSEIIENLLIDLSNQQYLDVFMYIFMLYFLYLGWKKGAVFQIFYLFSLLIAVSLSFRYSDEIGAYISSWLNSCLLYTSPSPRDYAASRMPSSA